MKKPKRTLEPGLPCSSCETPATSYCDVEGCTDLMCSAHHHIIGRLVATHEGQVVVGGPAEGLEFEWSFMYGADVCPSHAAHIREHGLP
jgi:hypothetical protein